MAKNLVIISALLLITCHKGVWIGSNAYRPKHPRFSVLKKPFVNSEGINNRFLYSFKEKSIINAQKTVIYNFSGFYRDGRVIGITLNDSELSEISLRNSWNNAPTIGYYTTKGNSIELEYFLPTDGGLYVTRHGIIRKDTILLMKFSSLLYKPENRHDTLVVSSFPLR